MATENAVRVSVFRIGQLGYRSSVPTPEGIDLARHRDAVAGSPSIWVRRGIVVVLVVFLVAALWGVFGQRPHVSTAAGPVAAFSVSAPTRVRGGLAFQGRFIVEGRREIADTTLLLDDGWSEQLTVNTIEPAPVREESRDGRLALRFGRLEAGRRLIAYLQFHVNPTNVGRRSQRVVLADGNRELVAIDRTMTVFP